MQRLLYTFLLLTIFTVNVFGQSESKRIADQIAPLLSDDTAFVAHADLSKVDFETLDAKLRPFLLDKAVFLTEEEDTETAKKSVNDTLDAAKAAAKGFLAMAGKMYDVRDVYFIACVEANQMEKPGVFAVPLKDNAHAATLKAEIPKEMGFVFRKSGKFLLLLPTRGGNPDSDEKMEQFWSMFDPVQPAVRPELLAALESVEGSTAQAAFIPPAYMKRVFEETTEKLPEPFDDTPVTVVTHGIKWAALGIDLKELKIDLIVQSEHEQAAKDLRSLLDSSLLFGFETLMKMPDSDLTLLNFGVRKEDVFTFLKQMLPAQKGDRLEITLDEKFVSENGKQFLEIPGVMIDAAKQSARNAQCMNCMKQFGLCLHNYHDVYGCFPKAFTVDKDGKPLHSWRVAILPFMEQQELYNKIRRDEPWDSEYNKQFHTQCPAMLQCPQACAKIPGMKKNGLTTYSLIIGKKAYPTEGKYQISSITDGTSCTWAVVEKKTPFCWMDPNGNITQENAEKGINKDDSGIGAVHSSGLKRTTNVTFFDGSARVYAENLSLDSIKRFITRNGGEATTEEYDGETKP